MKKFFALLAAASCALGLMASDYTGRLDVTVNGEGGSQETGITIVPETDGTYTLLLKNFVLVSGDDHIGVGNIELANVDGTTEFGFTRLNVSQSVDITAGDAEGIEDWLGPLLGQVPLEMTATFSDQILSVNIDIDMTETLGQVIKVGFIGTDPTAMPQPGLKGDVDGNSVVDTGDIGAVINIMLGK